MFDDRLQTEFYSGVVVYTIGRSGGVSCYSYFPNGKGNTDARVVGVPETRMPFVMRIVHKSVVRYYRACGQR